ncbi:RtcB family protein [Halomonas piscis]|uniref:RtcB family protein n=1 Tax=Halomonas piscis TaxID=3031727 RepID=UPI00289FA593|nr:RtcB family protein [Halomonas piscis]
MTQTNVRPFSGKAVIDTEALPIKLWLDESELGQGALDQARDLANLPYAFRHIAIMPDSHQGYGMPIGGVLATRDAIVPNAVGVDIGCGMGSLRTNLDDIGTADLKAIMKQIRKTVPVGSAHHKTPQDEAWMPERKGELPVVEAQYDRALYQLGTLGGGNHFIEVQKGSDGHVWIMVHSGSRNLGFTVASHYHEVAKSLNEADGDPLPPDLSHLPKTSEFFALYRDEMNYCLEFALANRQLMMERVKQAFVEVMGDIDFSHFINKPHNFAAEEAHFGEQVMVHRKGATRARAGEWGMIPGSQGTRSFLVTGKGEAFSFHSCSHGAGRVMSRARARKTLDFKAEAKRLKEQGVLHALRGRKDLDEAPGSYKDIDTVMRNQKDLVDVQVELAPLAVVKG